MKIILRESYESLGRPGDIVEVKGGYARNYLVPQGIAYPANRFYKKMFEQERDELLRKDAVARQKAEGVAETATGLSVEFIVKIGDRGKMHGAITNSDIAAALEEKGITVDRRKIALPEPIKTTGSHEIRVKLHADVGFFVTVNIVPELPQEEEDIEDDTKATTEATEELINDMDVPEIVQLEPVEKEKAAENKADDAANSVEMVEVVEVKPADEKNDDK